MFRYDSGGPGSQDLATLSEILKGKESNTTLHNGTQNSKNWP